MRRVVVHADSAAYRIAAQELPLSTEAVAGEAAEIAVVGGSHWVGDADRAAGSAQVVVVAGDAAAGTVEINQLRAQLGVVPVLVERPRLRRDLVDDALSARTSYAAAPPRLVVGECRADRAHLHPALADLVGWCRVFAGDLVVSAADDARDSVSALVVGGDHQVPVVLRMTQTDRHTPLLRVTAIGEVTTEVVIDDLGGRPTVSTRTSAGVVVAPTRWETSERFTLRRALELLDGVRGQDDLTALSRDAALVETLLR